MDDVRTTADYTRLRELRSETMTDETLYGDSVFTEESLPVLAQVSVPEMAAPGEYVLDVAAALRDEPVPSEHGDVLREQIDDAYTLWEENGSAGPYEWLYASMDWDDGTGRVAGFAAGLLVDVAVAAELVFRVDAYNVPVDDTGVKQVAAVCALPAAWLGAKLGAMHVSQNRLADDIEEAYNTIVNQLP